MHSSSQMSNAYILGKAGPGNRPRFYTRIRYQLPLLLLISVGLPFALRTSMNPGLLFVAGTVNTVIMGSIASALSYLLWRRLHVFPGTHALASAAWSVLIVYVLLLALVTLFRVDYNRTLLTATPILALAWLVLLSLVLSRTSPIRIGVVPGGRSALLPKTTSIEWHPLSDPDDGADCQGYVVDLRHDHAPEWELAMVEWTLSGIPVYHVKQITEHLTGRVSIDHLSENQLGSVLPNLGYIAGKHMLDVAMVVLLAILLVPVCLIVALLILVVDGRPVLFIQERIGYRGQVFKMYKFRTMRTAPMESVADRQSQARTLDGDPRITPLGRVLRKYRIDELPQIMNIIKGEMSWIGPRPEARALGEHYEAAFPFYRYRYAVRPGITGWAQVSQGHVTDDEGVQRKLEYDFFYAKNVSFWLDLIIVLKTVRTVIGGIGAK